MSETMHVAPFITCEPCHRLIPVFSGNPIVDYLKGTPPTCPACGKPVDVWSSIVGLLETGGFQVGSLPLGANQTLIPFRLPAGKLVKIELEAHGIPRGAKIIHRSYHGHGGEGFLAALESRGQSPDAFVIGDHVHVYGASFGDDPCTTGNEYSLAVTWAEPSADDEAWNSLIDAFEAYANGRLAKAIIPANVAVELSLERVLRTFLLATGLGKDAVSTFLKDGATYGHQLKVLLPALASLTDAPALPAAVWSNLKGLLTKRHAMAHTGTTGHALDRSQVAAWLSAALFGFHYVGLVGPILAERARSKLDGTS
jgi:hypothetical protein